MLAVDGSPDGLETPVKAWTHQADLSIRIVVYINMPAQLLYLISWTEDIASNQKASALVTLSINAVNSKMIMPAKWTRDIFSPKTDSKAQTCWSESIWTGYNSTHLDRI